MNEKKLLVFTGLLSCIILICGCETAAGTAKGVACGVGSTAESVAKDTKNTYNFILAIDEWFKRNYW